MAIFNGCEAMLVCSKKVIKRVRCGLRLLKNKRQAIARQLRKDLAELIQSSHEEIAFNRLRYLKFACHESIRKEKEERNIIGPQPEAKQNAGSGASVTDAKTSS
ncbi:hypothetical protein JHK87_001351 [Glycine soja]|nr:hypothetical protein JHK87_001351 [Glycine soja]